MERIEGRIEDQAGRLEYLLHFLQDENPRCRDMEIPDDGEGRRRLLRALMNVRPPWPIGGDFLEVQDAYLREETRRKGIVDAEALPVAAEEPGASVLSLWRGNITTLKADAIVRPIAWHVCSICSFKTASIEKFTTACAIGFAPSFLYIYHIMFAA